MQNKKSIRFYKDHEVRAIGDEEKSLKKAGNELTTRCSQLKMTARYIRFKLGFC